MKNRKKKLFWLAVMIPSGAIMGIIACVFLTGISELIYESDYYYWLVFQLVDHPIRSYAVMGIACAIINEIYEWMKELWQYAEVDDDEWEEPLDEDDII